MPWARASALDRHLACPAASHLPMFDRGVWSPGYLMNPSLVFTAPSITPDSRDDSAARWGTAMHDAKAGNDQAQDPWLLWMTPHRERLWPNRLGEHEVSISWDCETKSLEVFRSANEDERTRWKMSRGPNCVVGTADWWASLPSGEPWVDDLKTGWRQPEVLTPPMLFYLMCRMKDTSANGWDVGRLSITWAPRATVAESEDGPPAPTRDGLWRQVSRTVLAGFEEELHWAWVRATGLNPAPRPGGHCMYCPSADVCDKANG